MALTNQARIAIRIDGLSLQSGQASGVLAMTATAPNRPHRPSSTSPHCTAFRSFAPGQERARAGPPAAARVRRWRCVAISQASLLAQAPHEVFINGGRDGAVRHEISFRREAGPLDGRGRIKKASALASRRNQRRCGVNALRALAGNRW